jgi:predicted 3-demethylubiquinone-9 3-methyltransferase (glyoxalase superfamily)
MQRIRPCLWFDDRIEEAVNFYVSVFNDAKILDLKRVEQDGASKVLTIRFELNGEEFVALNGGPQFKFTEAISFIITCKSQKKVDYYWHRLSEGGEEGNCGWLKDKFGLSWQVVPKALPKLLGSKNAKTRDRVMQAMLQMKKIDVAALEAAADGTAVPAPTPKALAARKSKAAAARERAKSRG